MGGLKTIRDVVTRKRKLKWTEIIVPAVFIFYVVMRSVDRVFNTRISKILNDPVYNTIYSNIIFPIGLFVAQSIVNIAYILYMRFVAKDNRYGLSFFHPRSKLASTSGAFPQYLLCLFIIGDALMNLLSGWGVSKMDQTLQNILTQFTLVFTVMFSYTFLKTRYRQCHYIAVLLVICSVLQSITVEVQTNDPPLSEYKAGDGKYYQTSAIYFVMMFLSTIPGAGGNVFKQWCLQGIGAKFGELDVFYASFWSSIWQILVSFVLLMFVWVPFPGIESPVTPATTGDAIRDTFQCFVGIAPESASDLQKSLCTLPSGTALEWFVIYAVFNLSFNVSFLFLTKYLSSTWVQVSNVAVVFLSSLLGMSPLIMGQAAENITFEEYMGLVVGFIALWVYNLEDEINANGEDVYLINKRKKEEEEYLGDDDVLARVKAGGSKDLESDEEPVSNADEEEPHEELGSSILMMQRA